MKNIGIILRLSIVFAFLYPAIDSFFHPDTWYSFFPVGVLAILPFDLEIASIFFSIFEIIIAAGILFMPRPVWPAIIAGVVLLAITFLNWSSFDIVFRDISLALTAFALALVYKR